MITQKEIAARAGVSRATVSRGFADSNSISPKNLQKINTVLVELGLPRLGGQQIAGAPAGRYVLVMAGDVSGHFFGPVIRGICNQLQNSGIHAVVYNSSYKPELEEEQIRLAEARQYLGVILVSATEQDSMSELLRNSCIPVITVNRYLRSAETDVVSIDNYMGGYVAANYLMEKGHTRIGHIAGHRDSIPQEDRVRGFRDAMNAIQSDDCYEVYYGENNVERGYQVANDLIRRGIPHTALFVVDFLIAIGVVNALRDRGYRVPEDISVLCFDDSPYISKAGLNLSTVRYDPDKMGQMAVNTLLRRMGNPTDNKYHVLLLPQLIERNSVLPINR